MEILAVDPGTKKSAFVYCGVSSGKVDYIIDADIVDNDELLGMVKTEDYSGLVIEMIQSFGMPAGSSLFETCVWIGRFFEVAMTLTGYYPELIYRREEKLHICESPKANDATIRHALIDRFAKHDYKFGRGTKKNPDWFYGFKQDMWAAYAVGLTYIETKLRKEQ